MLRRITALGLGLVLLAGCGNESASETPGGAGDSPSTAAAAITQADAEAAFDGLGELGDAWKHKDCAKIAYLTTWAEAALGESLCDAARNGRPAPGFTAYTDPEFYLPDSEGGSGDAPWFAVLAHKPKPAYFVFVRSEGRWRLGAGPIPVVGDAPAIEGEVRAAEADAGIALRARLVPTRHVAFLTDAAGVSGVRFASGDPMRDLLRDLVRAPSSASPDRVETDVRLEGPSRAIALPDGAALVFHALRVVYTQRPGSGRSSLVHPRWSAADLRAFTGRSAPGAVTGSDLVVLATRVAKDNELTTVGLRRTLAGITSGASG
ncbi:hypothetical protein [Microbispora sp. ATCC PTA-5024]|uniref:hypothetical protein n=1 Tax=Microbispora sp. ATCC PTA-5024 TaxID=316330 RepID=UPI0004220ECC|nr:hypothetical protein [Microbispora sp. ATCC PTA-5024]